ncbi:MAG: galactose-1-phosphate uridylyltransferase [Terriglobia bacterium]
MELRKDPITMSWVIVESGSEPGRDKERCPLCPGNEMLAPQTIYSFPDSRADWQVRVTPHPHPLYIIETDPQRRGEGLYDKMRNLGAHEIIIETRDHYLALSQQSDENVAQVLHAYLQRLGDLKKDRRFRYITVSRNQGQAAGQDLVHPHSEITATPFIPRRVGYELRASLRYFALKERCLICDIVKQELDQQVRTVDCDGHFVSFCPFASRVPYETWILPTYHHAQFEEDLTSWENQLRLARFLKSILQRLESITPEYHLVLHTSPNTNALYERASAWQTLSEDYHWHIEILPVVAARSKSYSLKEVYYNPLLPEDAAKELRAVPLDALETPHLT